MSFFGLGSGGLKVHIALSADPNKSSSPGIIPLDHTPSWKVRKNPFSCLRYPAPIAPQPPQQPPQQTTNNIDLLGGDDHHSVAASDVSALTSPTMATGANEHTFSQASLAGDGGRGNGVTTFAYEATEDVEGTVTLTLPAGKKADHLGIKIQFIGRIDMGYAAHEGRPHYDFISLSKELMPPGTIYENRTTLPFHFRSIEKEHETYRGRNVSVRYFIRVVVERKFLPPIQKDHDLIVHIRGTEPEVNEPIKMEVGIEDCLHIEFEYERRCYHLHDVILGKINFLLVRIKIKHMELAVIRRETSGEGVAAAVANSGQPPPQTSSQPAAGPAPGAAGSQSSSHILTETQTLIKYEIMDGAPVKGETIPVRLYLRGIPADLTPTYDAVNNRFTVRYFLNLVLVDEEDRRYFKQQEIILWRKNLG